MKATQPSSGSSGPPSGGAKNFMGLRGKLLLYVLPLIVAVLLLSGLIATRKSRSSLLELSDTGLSQGAKSLGDAIAQGMNDALADAMTTARLDLAAQAIETADPKNLLWYADEAVTTKRKYSAIVVADKTGKIVGSNTLARDGKKLPVALVGRSVASESWFAQALKSARSHAVAVPPGRPQYLDGILAADERVAGFAFPVFDVLDEPIGTLTVFVSLNALGALLDGFAVVKDGAVESVAVVTNEQGSAVVLPPSQRTFAGTGLPSEPLAKWHDSKSGIDYFVSSQPIGGAVADWKWRLSALKTVSSLEEPVDRMSDTLLFVFFASVGLATIVMVYIATKIVRPIRSLTEATSSTVKASDFKALPVVSHDEVGTLTESFNRMFSAIRDYEVGLEEKVAARTRDLAEAKQEVSDILDNMGQAIFTIDRENKVGSQFSSVTRTMFPDLEIARSSVFDLLQITSKQNDELYRKFDFWLMCVLGNDEIQWISAGDDPIKEHKIQRNANGDTLDVELSFAPIYKNDEVDRVMVVVKDVTALKALEGEVVRKDQENQNNLSRLAEIAGMDAELFETFMQESEAILRDCSEAVDVLAANPDDPEGIGRLFRGMHTIKGNARIFKITTVQNAAHSVEDFFQKIRDGEEKVTPEVVEQVRERVNEVNALLKDFARLARQVLLGGEPASKADDLQAFFDQGQGLLDRLAKSSDLAPSESQELADAVESYNQVCRKRSLAALPTRLGELEAALRDPALGEAQGRDAVASAVEALRVAFDRTKQLSLDLQDTAKLEQYLQESSPMLADIDAAFKAWLDDSDASKGVAHIDAVMRLMHTFKAHARGMGMRTIEQAAHVTEEALVEARNRSRVTASDYAALVGDIGSLVADARGLSGRTESTSKRRGTLVKIPEARVLEVRKRCRDLVKLRKDPSSDGALEAPTLQELTRAVARLTSVPLGDVFERFKKMTLDLAGELGKRVDDLRVEDNEIEVDAKIADKIRDVLMHALRNAVDHGIESPDVRTAASKPAKGNISIRCEESDGMLAVYLSDDGRGVDYEAIKAKAFQKGIFTAEKLETVTEKELLNLIFLSGFSTAKKVTDVSGRGVGLDFAAATVRDMGGSIDFTSTFGIGTEMAIRIPSKFYEEA